MLRFSAFFVKAGVACIEILAVQAILRNAKGIAEALEVYDLTHTKETQNVGHVRIV